MADTGMIVEIQCNKDASVVTFPDIYPCVTFLATLKLYIKKCP